MGCFSGHLMSAASDQKLFCQLCSPFCCSFNEFLEEKVISPSYSSAILTPPPPIFIIALFAIAKIWKQPRFLFLEEWVKKQSICVCVCTRIHTDTYKRNMENITVDVFHGHFESSRRLDSLRHWFSWKTWACRDSVHSSLWDLRTLWARPPGKSLMGPPTSQWLD